MSQQYINFSPYHVLHACSTLMFRFKKTAKDEFFKVVLQLYENSYMNRRTNLKALVVHPKMLVASMVGGLKKCLS